MVLQPLTGRRPFCPCPGCEQEQGHGVSEEVAVDAPKAGRSVLANAASFPAVPHPPAAICAPKGDAFVSKSHRGRPDCNHYSFRWEGAD